MTRTFLTIAAAIALLSAPAHAGLTQTKAAPVTVGEWKVSPLAFGCIARRGYDQIELDFNGKLGIGFDVANTSPPAGVTDLPVRLTIHAKSIDAKASLPYPNSPTRVTYSGPDNGFFEALKKPGAIQIASANAGAALTGPASFNAAGLDKATVAITNCMKELRTPGRPAVLFSEIKPNDFYDVCPSEWQGSIPARTHRLSIDAKGKVTEAVDLTYYPVIPGSRSPEGEFNSALRKKLRSKVSFHPATDAAGNFIASEATYSTKPVRCDR